MGIASMINILAGLMKMKAVAVLLGPGGVGLFGLYQSVMQSASSIAGLGMEVSATREFAVTTASGKIDAAARIWWALFLGLMVQGVLLCALFWLFHDRVGNYLGVGADIPVQVGWLGLGVVFSVLAGAQSAFLAGTRQVKKVAWLQSGSALLSFVLGTLIIFLYGEKGILPLVLTAPFFGFLIGFTILPHEILFNKIIYFRSLFEDWFKLIKSGFPFFLTGLISNFSILIVQLLVREETGIESLGYFKAAWSIGMTYLGFILGAMSTDYYPHLSAISGNHDKTTKLVNQQTEVALLIFSPVMLFIMGGAPWIVELLYSKEFYKAADILRLQLFGDILKILSWPMAFLLLATGSGKFYLVSEFLGMTSFVAAVVLITPFLGIDATGVGFIILYVVYYLVVLFFLRRIADFRLGFYVKIISLVVFLLSFFVFVVSIYSEFYGFCVGIVLSFLFSVFSFFRLSRLAGATDLFGRPARLFGIARNWLEKRVHR